MSVYACRVDDVPLGEGRAITLDGRRIADFTYAQMSPDARLRWTAVAEDVYRRLLDSNEDIGLATVYRVLTQFESAGLVTRHHFEGGTAVFGGATGEDWPLLVPSNVVVAGANFWPNDMTLPSTSQEYR